VQKAFPEATDCSLLSLLVKTEDFSQAVLREKLL
jgi:hypothetical protein